MSTTPAAITMEIIRSWSADELKKQMANPSVLTQIEELLTSRIAKEVVPAVEPVVAEIPVKSQEEIDAEVAQAEADRLAKIQADEAAAALAAKEKEAADRAAELKAAGITIEYDKNGGIVRIVKTYQAKDEAGNDIGRLTNLVAKSWVDLSRQEQDAHVNAVRFAERIKKQKVTFNKEKIAEPVLSDDELLKIHEDLKSEDRDKAAEAAKKLREQDEQDKQKKLELAIENARQSQVAFEWMATHPEYNRCQANSDIIKGYLTDNNLEFTFDNLEIAYVATETQLAPKEVPAAPVAPVVNPPATPPVPPVAVVPAAPAVPDNSAPVRRPGVNAGLVPGQQSGTRTQSGPVGLTKKDIAKWTREQMRTEMKNPARRAEIDRVLAAPSKPS